MKVENFALTLSITYFIFQESCDAGKYRPEVNVDCELCPRGTWRSLSLDNCMPCPENKTTIDGQIAIEEDKCEQGNLWLSEL